MQLEEDPFKFRKCGVTPRSDEENSDSSCVALSHTAGGLNHAINRPLLSDEQKVKALHSVSTHHKSRVHLKSTKPIDQKGLQPLNLW